MNGDAAKALAHSRKSCEDDKREVEVQVYSHCKARLR